MSTKPYHCHLLQSDGTLSYSGISMDVLEELAKNVGFCYTLVSKPGYRATAVINEVLNTSTPVNFGIGSITITAERFAVCTCPLAQYGCIAESNCKCPLFLGRGTSTSASHTTRSHCKY